MHIPFCESLCYFCACNKIITKDHERVGEYLRYLDKEMALVAAQIGPDRKAVQLHLGGGTPTFFSADELGQLMAMLRRHFDFTPDAELGVEIDPRTVGEGTLAMLAGLLGNIGCKSDDEDWYLGARGFKFCGPTIVYAFMQAMGLVNDHIEGCGTRARAQAARAAFVPPQ